ncbi:Colanic acid biosynthsis UDP-glucose lipid carrier transferase WcaJ [Escherichia coli ISC7]|uniref:Colanic acid biosynthsis UDP-glucose lipid carrier transferase WcaJ n=1 Tax=Escherichia coli ISC7 TaxID=1432555 RepID=W1F8W4_ECOLX|nr:Colanic acid biosynthsis UDP-glucose lipid carrier transferase WcaJ [Escherichia coli ISC7]
MKWWAFYHDPKPGGVSNDWAGNLQQLVEDAKAGKIHNVYIAMQMCDGARVKKLVHQLADTTCSVLLIPDVFTFNILHSRLEEMNGVPVVPLYDTPLSGVNRLLKTCGRHCAGDADLAADLPGAVLYCAGGETQFTWAGYFPPDSLRHGWQADQSVEVPFHESDGERQSGDSGDAERSARH